MSPQYDPFNSLSPRNNQYVPQRPYDPCALQSDSHYTSPRPLKSTVHTILPSTEIHVDKTSLINIKDVINQNSNLLTEDGCGTLAQRLAKQAVFGLSVMACCTPKGSKRFPALPQTELYELKKAVFKELNKFHHRPAAFQTVWDKKCMVAIEQACNRCRTKR